MIISKIKWKDKSNNKNAKRNSRRDSFEYWNIDVIILFIIKVN